MALNSPSIRRFNNTPITKQVPRETTIESHERLKADFFASGGKIDVIPGFTDIAPRPPHREPQQVVKQPRKAPAQALPGDTAEWRTIPGYSKYAAAQDQRIKARKSGILIKGRVVGKVVITADDGLPMDVFRADLVKMAWGEV